MIEVFYILCYVSPATYRDETYKAKIVCRYLSKNAFVSRLSSILRNCFLQAKYCSYFFRIYCDRQVLKRRVMYIEVNIETILRNNFYRTKEIYNQLV